MVEGPLMTRMEQEVAYQQEIEEGMAKAERKERDDLIRENYKLGQDIENGRACKQFWDGKVGRFVLNRAIDDAEAAKRGLVEVKRSEFKNSFEYEAAISELQTQAMIPTMVYNWLNDAIRAAQEAEDILSGEEE